MHTRPDYQEFDCRQVAATATGILNAFGITTHPADGHPSIWIDHGWQWWRQIGHLSVRDQAIHIWPHRGISEADMSVLRGAACEAFCTPPAVTAHWVHSGSEWECAISVRAQ
ncbi:hypothetical protein IU418_13380 [Nocardia farcinica]|uniref:hypothetical protein n=1 Tax=Nocardia farcinica TaxID=37329 RepID=UPI001B3C51CE|nr:hypothetical protein [Nocardia farcinica]MBF6538196.1 hypothetical protein [Nocardia farcinica]